MVKALFFDVFGTVVDWRTSVAEQLADWGREIGIERDWMAMAMRWRALYQPAMELIRGGARGYVKLDILHRENLDVVLAEFDLDATSEAERRHLTRIWHHLTPWPDVTEGLARLRPRYLLAPVSNGNIALMVNLARSAGLPWDTVLGAEVARDYKPMPIVYKASADAFDLSPHDCMMVAAHNDDLQAAAGCGLKTAFVPRPLEYGPEQTSDLQADGAWTIVASSFTDLADQLDC